MDLLIKNVGFVLMAYAFTHLYVAASIFNTRNPTLAKAQQVEPGFVPIRPWLQKFRFFRSMMECYFCSGLWCSIPAYAVYWWWSGLGFASTVAADAIAHVLSGAVLVWLFKKKIDIMDSLAQSPLSVLPEADVQEIPVQAPAIPMAEDK